MTVVEMLKKMGGSDERMSRSVWENKAWVSVDHDSGTMWLSSVDVLYTMRWTPSCYDLMADDWNFWEMPDDQE